MAVIEINDLKAPGLNLFAGEESYMKDLSDEELNIEGGYAEYIYAAKVASPYAVASSGVCAGVATVAGGIAVSAYVGYQMAS